MKEKYRTTNITHNKPHPSVVVIIHGIKYTIPDGVELIRIEKLNSNDINDAIQECWLAVAGGKNPNSVISSYERRQRKIRNLESQYEQESQDKAKNISSTMGETRASSRLR